MRAEKDHEDTRVLGRRRKESSQTPSLGNVAEVSFHLVGRQCHCIEEMRQLPQESLMPVVFWSLRLAHRAVNTVSPSGSAKEGRTSHYLLCVGSMLDVLYTLAPLSRRVQTSGSKAIIFLSFFLLGK